jgi:hypothetical protein
MDARRNWTPFVRARVRISAKSCFPKSPVSAKVPRIACDDASADLHRIRTPGCFKLKQLRCRECR